MLRETNNVKHKTQAKRITRAKRRMKQNMIDRIVEKVRKELLHVKGDAEIEFEIDGQKVWVDVREWHASDGSGRWGREIFECAVNDEPCAKDFECISVPYADMDMSLFRETDPYFIHLH